MSLRDRSSHSHRNSAMVWYCHHTTEARLASVFLIKYSMKKSTPNDDVLDMNYKQIAKVKYLNEQFQ